MEERSKIRTKFCCESCEQHIGSAADAEPAISQRMFYYRNTEMTSDYGHIYDYVIDDVDGPQLKGKYKIPYKATLPGLAFNYDLKKFLLGQSISLQSIIVIA